MQDLLCKTAYSWCKIVFKTNAHKPPTKAHADVSSGASVLAVNWEIYVSESFQD